MTFNNFGMTVNVSVQVEGAIFYFYFLFFNGESKYHARGSKFPEKVRDDQSSVKHGKNAYGKVTLTHMEMVRCTSCVRSIRSLEGAVVTIKIKHKFRAYIECHFTSDLYFIF